MELIKIQELKDKGRFDAAPFVSCDSSLVRFTKRIPSQKIGNISYIHKVRNRDSRIYVNDESRGLMYLSNTDMQKSSYDSVQYMSKKFLSNLESQKLKKGDIIVSAVGTIGQVALINELLENAVISGNILRFTPKMEGGYIYAYLQSKYGQANLINIASGSVQDFITPPKLSEFEIPILSESIQKITHKLILDASNLRLQANAMIMKAQNYFDNLNINYKYGAKTSQLISIKQLSRGYKRFDASYAIVCEKVEKSIIENQVQYTTISAQSSNIFIGPRAKRNYVKNGVPFLTTSAMQKFDPTKTDRYLSSKNSQGFIVSEGWILTTRSGTLGDTVFTLPCMDSFAVTEDAIRIVINQNSELSNYYIYAFLKSSIGKSSLLSGSYGSVIQHLNEDYVGDIKVPIFSHGIIEEINISVKKHVDFLNEAILKEKSAIKLIENEIESWQKF